MTEETTTQVAQTQDKGTAVSKAGKDAVANLFDRMQGEWAKVLPAKITPERFARVALSQVRRNPKLNEALMSEQGKLSLLDKLMSCATIGIEPDGRLAHLIPYKNEVQLIIDYKGLVQLVINSGLIANIHADKVCENDEFEYDCGEIIKHKIDFHKDRGASYAFYCQVRFKDGTRKCEVMTKVEVDAVRNRSRAGQSGPWQTDYDEMAKKTVFRRVSKWLPMASEVKDVFEADDDRIEDIRNVTPKAAFDIDVK